MIPGFQVLDADAVAARLTPAAAVSALEAALRGGLDPGASAPRARVPVPGGELLLMPAHDDRYAVVKIAGVAPENPAQGLPTITGGVLLLDARTLMPLALMDAPALTELRTAAVSALAAGRLAPADPHHLVLFGAGPQARAHLRALAAVLPSLRRVTVVTRSPGRAAELIALAERSGLVCEVGDAKLVTEADVVCCCTTARAPLFDGAAVRDGALVIAVGAHEPTAREVDATLVARAAVAVEHRPTALREAGELAGLHAGDLAADLAELVRAGLPMTDDRPALFKSVGMAWQDLVVAGAVYDGG
ncbi:ornithine cyclodeaminase family protein [Streptacidiphilus jiangxiensis]|uniref:Ornithine cyclodeaminase n=1 Tax=Streptacidiphilus jiangxiensis TaxID=235985 RepID=A0A1H7YK67_STRJI|nr:ornithine cyclodeaminase family protein [Streptacidiphilus jiangxiensis]SEM46642.1 ornithine cyclodeaminase [Streptacidiphilus jiangxiensis]